MACLGLLPLTRTAACIAESAEWVLLCCHLDEICFNFFDEKGGGEGHGDYKVDFAREESGYMVRRQDGSLDFRKSTWYNII